MAICSYIFIDNRLRLNICMNLSQVHHMYIRNPGRDMLILFNNSFPRLIMSSERLIKSSERFIMSSERLIKSSERVIMSSERLIKSSE